MGKAEEAAAKRRTKAARKRLRSSGGGPGSGLNAVIAAKKRRKAGKRRICEGMCYTLPTPEDPFNDRALGRGKKKRNRDEQAASDEDNDGINDDCDQNPGSDEQTDLSLEDEADEDTSGDEDDAAAYDRSFFSRVAASSNGARIVSGSIAESGRSPSQFETSLWEACQGGRDVIGTVQDLKTSALGFVPAVADYIVKQPSKSRRSGKPLALVLVSSQQDASYIRNLCKPLKPLLGIHCISIHPGTSLERQMEGIESSSCQILVATPERLCQLLSNKALSLLDISFLVVAALDELIQKGFKDKLEIIKQQTSHTMQVLMLSKSFPEAAIRVTRSYVEDPVARVVQDQTLAEQAACIVQEVSVIVDDSKRFSKVVEILHQHREDDGTLPRTLILTRKIQDAIVLLSQLNSEGFSKAVASAFESRNNQHTSLLDLMVSPEDMLGSIDLSGFETVIILECPASIAMYSSILTSMARSSVHGILHTFCGCSSAPVAQQLVDVLKQCSQPVPSALDMLANAAAVVKRKFSR